MARHGSLAEQLDGFKRFATTPDHEPEPIQTNWAVVPANDNNPEDVADFAHERKILTTPSVSEIMRQVTTGDVARNDRGQIVGIGSLRFSDGAQTERAMTNGPDGKLIRFDARMPTGAMLGTREETEAALGGKSLTQRYAQLSNSFFAATLGVEYPLFIKSGPKRKGRNYSRDEAAEMLAAAKANTTDMPPITYCPPALACGTRNAADAFVGMKKGRKGESGSIPWTDLATLQSGRQVWREALRSLNPKSKHVLEAAVNAKTLADVGIAAGQSRTYAKFGGGGKRVLLASNDDLMRVIDDLSA